MKRQNELQVSCYRTFKGDCNLINHVWLGKVGARSGQKARFGQGLGRQG